MAARGPRDLQDFASIGAEGMITEEFNGQILGDVPVAVKLDYVCRDDDGGLIISDWKTGAGVCGDQQGL